MVYTKMSFPATRYQALASLQTGLEAILVIRVAPPKDFIVKPEI